MYDVAANNHPTNGCIDRLYEVPMDQSLRLCAVLLASCGAAGALNLSGRVLNPDGSGRSGVTVSLSGTSLAAVTTGDGAWALSGTSSVQASSIPFGHPSGNLQLQDGRLHAVLSGRDPLGRFLTREPRLADRGPVPAGRKLGAVPDTLLYRWDGKVFLRDTTSVSRSGMEREFDTTWNAGIVYGYLTDERDGHTYRTVGIRGQTWMAQNLNYRNSIGNPDTVGSCYDNRIDSCSKFGRLYSWVDVMQGAASSDSTPSGVRGVCPQGWHVPSDVEWQFLEVAAGMSAATAAASGYRGTTEGGKLKATWGWYLPGNGTDEYGFRILPAGMRNDGTSEYAGDDANFWTATTYSLFYPWRRGFQRPHTQVTRYANHEMLAYSLRCLRN
jgi:uncharacterized protein (TIGR02145 family)